MLLPNQQCVGGPSLIICKNLCGYVCWVTSALLRHDVRVVPLMMRGSGFVYVCAVCEEGVMPRRSSSLCTRCGSVYEGSVCECGKGKAWAHHNRVAWRKGEGEVSSSSRAGSGNGSGSRADGRIGGRTGSTTASRKLRLEVFERQGGICAGWGERRGACDRLATEDDHIVPRVFGGADLIDNHQGLCSECHAVKSAEERAALRRGVWITRL